METLKAERTKVVSVRSAGGGVSEERAAFVRWIMDPANKAAAAAVGFDLDGRSSSAAIQAAMEAVESARAAEAVEENEAGPAEEEWPDPLQSDMPFAEGWSACDGADAVQAAPGGVERNVRAKLDHHVEAEL